MVPSKHCQLDAAPTWLVKRLTNVLSPVIANMANVCFENGRFPTAQKQALVRPILKKPSNLSFVSKIVERLAANRFNAHTGLFNLLPARQSAYRQFHSTETAVTAVHNAIVQAIDSKRLSVLVLLDLSSAFDTVDHGILLNILQDRFGVRGHVYCWFKSYLTGRTQVFCTTSGRSDVVNLDLVDCSVPQGSVVGPQQFSAYTEDMSENIEIHINGHHFYADTTQLQGSTSIAELLPCLRRFER